jgi:hypothetical protein
VEALVAAEAPNTWVCFAQNSLLIAAILSQPGGSVQGKMRVTIQASFYFAGSYWL